VHLLFEEEASSWGIAVAIQETVQIKIVGSI
jgi:hypothetical protein